MKPPTYVTVAISTAVVAWRAMRAVGTVVSRALLAATTTLVLLFGLPGITAGVAHAAVTGGVYSATGTVVAVALQDGTIVIQSNLKGDPTWTVGAVVTDRTTFGGRAQSLQDIHPGDRVSMQWVREEDGDIARSVLVQ